jgi:hypothetical protein
MSFAILTENISCTKHTDNCISVPLWLQNETWIILLTINTFFTRLSDCKISLLYITAVTVMVSKHYWRHCCSKWGSINTKNVCSVHRGQHATPHNKTLSGNCFAVKYEVWNEHSQSSKMQEKVVLYQQIKRLTANFFSVEGLTFQSLRWRQHFFQMLVHTYCTTWHNITEDSHNNLAFHTTFKMQGTLQLSYSNRNSKLLSRLSLDKISHSCVSWLWKRICQCFQKHGQLQSCNTVCTSCHSNKNSAPPMLCIITQI